MIQLEDIVLELGCGYGRVLLSLVGKAHTVYGIDLSEDSITLTREFLKDYESIHLYTMNANSMTFQSNSFDIVLGIQNAISAFKISPEQLLIEALRVTKPGGKLILTSYSKNIWDARLEWFVQQAAEGLLGEIDFKKTGNGIIVCKDDFKATTYSKQDFQVVIDALNLTAEIFEVDKSSIFCVITKVIEKI